MATMVPCTHPQRCGVREHVAGSAAARDCAKAPALAGAVLAGAAAPPVPDFEADYDSTENADAAAAMNALGVSTTITYGGRHDKDGATGRDWEHDLWNVTFTRTADDGIRRSMTVPFSCGTGLGGEQPDPVEVFATYTRDVDDFHEYEGAVDDWANEYGYPNEPEPDEDFGFEIIGIKDGVTHAEDAATGASITVSQDPVSKQFNWSSVDRSGAADSGTSDDHDDAVSMATYSASYGRPAETQAVWYRLEAAASQWAAFSA